MMSEEEEEEEEKVVLVVGSLGLDRLLTVPSYPQADSKVRTTAYHEYGGGNSGNTASAMAKLSSFFSGQHSHSHSKFKIKLLSKVGDDAVGQQLKNELESVRVDCSLPLFILQPNTTTSFVTVLVSEQEHTRTCLHTPGTCGELTAQDVAHVDMEDIFQTNVVHLHSDSRHTEAALALAREARTRGIPVSVDVEKDRQSKAQDQLLEYATMLFTNTHQIDEYLQNLSHELEQTTGKTLLSSKPVLRNSLAGSSSPKAAATTTISSSKSTTTTTQEETLLKAIRPSFHFARLHGQTEKEIVITKGKMGSLHVQCNSYGTKAESEKSDALGSNFSSSNKNSNEVIEVHQEVTEQQLHKANGTTEKLISYASYKIHASGCLGNPDIVDTTGAGDAFIGAYILSKYNLMVNHPTMATDHNVDPIQFALDFSSWVAGKKLSGPGGRIGVPTGEDAVKELGRDLPSIQNNLKAALLSFGSS